MVLIRGSKEGLEARPEAGAWSVSGPKWQESGVKGGSEGLGQCQGRVWAGLQEVDGYKEL